MKKKQKETKNTQKELKIKNISEEVHDGSVLNPQKQHESDLTRRERRLLEKEKVKDMGMGAKLEYFWMYYKGVVFGFIGVLLLAYFLKDWYHNAQMKDVLSISVVNSGNLDAETLSADIKELLGYEDEYSQVTINTNLTTEPDGKNLDYYAQMAYVTQFQTKSVDVLILPESLYPAVNIDDYFLDMREVLDEETCEILGDRIKDGYVTFDDLSLRQTLQVAYEPVCMAVPINAVNVENAGKWIASLVSAE